MAADDDRDPAPDPWDEIVADSLGDEAGEVAFRFDEAPADPPPVDAAAFESPAAKVETGAAETSAAAEDALVEDWLSGDDGAADAAAPLAVFSPEDAAGGSSAIDIGTGASGVALHGAPDQEEIGADMFVAAAPKATPRRPATPAKKSGGIGHVIGVVLGGLLAIPIVVGILIGYVWLGGRDTMGLSKTPLAFLLPPKGGARAAGGSALDNLPTLPDPVDSPAEPEPEPGPGPGPDATAGDEPAAVEPTDVAVDAVADMPADEDVAVEPEPVAEPEPDLAVDAVAVDDPGLDAPGLDALAALDTPPPAAAAAAPPEPPPLDTAALDAAVGEAAALGAALGAADDTGDRAYRLLRTRWYRALARVAEELVTVENAAATSGRPLDAAPENVASLHGGIGSREALATELAALAPDWLAYADRGSDGVVLPVTFRSARRVGPYWTALVSLAVPDGQARDLTIIARREPAAVAGDRIVVTGVALDGGVIWAADVRAADADLSAGF